MKPIEVSPKDKIIAALRSGVYEQGRHMPYMNGRYCMIGVAAHTLGLEVTTDTTTHQCEELVARTLYPDPKDRTPVYLALNEAIDKNDKGCDFNQLADFLEDNLP